MIEVTYVDHMGDDMRVANAARVSFAKQVEEFTDKDEKLIKFLARHKHMSPFGHCFLSVHVKAPVFVARQLVKHKFLRWNEVSRRYVTFEPEFYEPDYWRKASSDKKQGSLQEEIKLPISYEYEDHCFELMEFYKNLLLSGVCPEQARMVLPQSMMTEWYWSGSLDAFTDMCKLRLPEDTQYESRLVAQQVYQILSDKFPVSTKALLDDYT